MRDNKRRRLKIFKNDDLNLFTTKFYFFSHLHGGGKGGGRGYRYPCLRYLTKNQTQPNRQSLTVTSKGPNYQNYHFFRYLGAVNHVPITDLLITDPNDPVTDLDRADEGEIEKMRHCIDTMYSDGYANFYYCVI